MEREIKLQNFVNEAYTITPAFFECLLSAEVVEASILIIILKLLLLLFKHPPINSFGAC